MTDHDKLREAIQYVAACRGNAMASMNEEGHMKYRLVLAAAESTLPKTKMVFEIEGTARTHAPYMRAYTAEDVALMHSYIECLHADGFGLITIRTKEVPV